MSTWIFHHNDGDGFAAATLIASEYCTLRSVKEMVDEDNFTNVRVPEDLHIIAVNYNKSMDLSPIQDGDTVYMLDYTSSRQDDIDSMNKLWKDHGKNIEYIHIDHHKSALTVIEQCEGLKEYLRINGGIFPTEEFEQAGCMLTFIAQSIGKSMFGLLFRGYYFKEEIPFNDLNIKEKFTDIEDDAPVWIKLTADHDIFSGRYLDSHEFARGAYYNGLYHTYLDVKNSDSFLCLLVNEQASKNSDIRQFVKSSYKTDEVSNKLYEKGKLIKGVLDGSYQKYLGKSFEIYINMSLSKELLDPTNKMDLQYNDDGVLNAEGKILCMNGFGNSEMFLNKFEEYDDCILFNFDGEYVEHSIYSKKSSSFPCHALAIWGGKFFGISGGGHEHAAGFYTDDLFFKKDRVFVLSDHTFTTLSKHNMHKGEFERLFGREDN